MKKIEHLIVKDGPQKYRIPFYTIKGEKPGKTLMVMAAQHGGEWVGIEVVRRLFAKIEPSALSGTFTAVPVANPMAVKSGQQHFLYDQKEKRLDKHPKEIVNKLCYNMNRIWPGNKNGSVLEQATAALWEHGVSKCDVLIDLHCYSRNNHNSVYVRADNTLELGRWLNIGFLADVAKDRLFNKKASAYKTLAQACKLHGKKALIIEFVGAHEIIEAEVQSGVRAILNLMRYLKMLPGKATPPQKQCVLVWGKTKNILLKSPSTGFMFNRRKVLDRVEKGEIIGDIFDLELGKITNHIKSPINGVITHLRYVNLVNKGELAAAVADLEKV